MLAPAIAKLLREQWLASKFKAPHQPVFANTIGRGLDYRDVGEDFRQTVRAAGISASGRLSLHSLRHAYASLLISNGLNVVYVSRQLGHANPNITLEVYTTCSPKQTTPTPREPRSNEATPRSPALARDVSPAVARSTQRLGAAPHSERRAPRSTAPAASGEASQA